MTNINQDNRLKCDVYGNKEWMPVKFHDGKNPDGTFRTTEGFRNVLTNQEADGSEPPYKAGDAHGFRVSDAYRRGYDQIKWNGGPDA